MVVDRDTIRRLSEELEKRLRRLQQFPGTQQLPGGLLTPGQGRGHPG